MENKAILQQAANQARGLAIDAIAECSSGHLGLPLGCAEIGAVLFSNGLQFNVEQPKWLNRDRFILSAGHGSMFIYSWLHIAGYDVSQQDLQSFRQQHSKTPGHPEYRETPGVEATTGPLGQGIGNAVGYAISGKKAAAEFNTADHTIFDHHVIALAGDGCLQEGVAREAIAYAGHTKLDNLIVIYDSNQVTLDAMANRSQSEDVSSYFQSQGWQVLTVDGHDLIAIARTLQVAKSSEERKPCVIIATTEIGRGITQVAGTQKAHGEGGAKFAVEAKTTLGLPANKFYVSEEVKTFFQECQQQQQQKYQQWHEQLLAWQKSNPELADILFDTHAINFDTAIDKFASNYSDATRNTNGTVINAVAKVDPKHITASADLYGSTKNYLTDGGDFLADNYTGNNLWVGIREHAMGAIANGIAYDDIYRISCATFLVFADYLRPAIRLAGLAELPVTYIFTHDSVAVGEDGPTHQPVETVSALRLIPNVDVIRPGDAEEVAGAWIAAQQRHNGPTCLILTRQKIPSWQHISAQEKRSGTQRGGYVFAREEGDLELILMATGSELQHCMHYYNRVSGKGVRVVSMPAMDIFARQSEAYREEILPADITKRIAIEAGVSALWYRYVGSAGKVIGIDRFGISAPGDEVMTSLGITAEAITNTVTELS